MADQIPAIKIIFTTGLEGSFELTAPFTNAVRPNARYTVRSIRCLSSIIADGEDPRSFYESYNVPDIDYIRDLQNDVAIIGIQAVTGEYVYVPQSFIASYPMISGVSYRPLSVVLPLGMIPDDQDLTNLQAKADILVADLLGIESTSRLVVVGASELHDENAHQRIMLERANMVKVSESPAAMVVRLERENARLREENAALSAAIALTL